MSILQLQRRLHEVGRIRLGRQVAIPGRKANRPERLDRFRFTSVSERAIRGVAQLYGGEPQRWQDAPVGEQWELFSAAREIDVVLPPEALAFSQWYELWSGGGAKRRCDGEHELFSDGPCLCDPEKRECAPHTRLSLMLRRLPGIGLWRLDTQGWYAAAELSGAVAMAELIVGAVGRSVLPARLGITSRSVKRPDPKDESKVVTRNFVVATLDFDVDVGALALGRGERVPVALPPPDSEPVVLEAVSAVPEPVDGAPPGVVPLPSGMVPSVAEQITSMELPAPVPKRPLASTGRRPRTAAERAAQGVSRGLPTEPAGAPTPAGAADAAPPPSLTLSGDPRTEALHRIDVATARLYGLHRGPAASAVYSDHGFDQSSRPQAWLGQLGTEQLGRLADDLEAKL
jgi:hypothetical protein